MRRTGAITTVLACLAWSLLGGVSGAADAPTPARWPIAVGTQPALDTTAHSIRFAGPDRYQTNLATVLGLRGSGGYPFSTSDRSADWWGLGTCPFAVLLVAGDTFADALTAASLSDPTDGSDEPRLERVAAADPLFDPIGGFGRVDTDSAPIVMTRSARQGATTLTAAARQSLADLATGGCRTAREVIIVGGDAAIAPSIETEVLSLGYDEVFRVAGTDRFDTAARVAVSLGTEAAPPGGCVDEDVDEGDARMGFYGNAVVEYRRSATDCRLLGRTVALADGATGADALAAGWWTSYWQVPMLLVGADGNLPAPTVAALQSMDIDNIVVLGGTARMPESTIDLATALASATSVRVAGVDRYATSVEMARSFGGWFATGSAADGAGGLVCIAASSGSGTAAVGWADALAAGPWCGRASAASIAAPARALSPIDGEWTLQSGAAPPPARDAVPVLLVPAGEPVPSSVLAFLQSVFDPITSWCSGATAPTDGCAAPGFGVAFGGAGSLTGSAVEQIARLVSGGRYDDVSDLTPRVDDAFLTRLAMTPVFGEVGEPGAPLLACVLRGGVHDVRWLQASADLAWRSQVAEGDLAAAGVYIADDDGVTRGQGSAPTCLRFGAMSDTVAVRGASLSGHPAETRTFAVEAASTLELDADVRMGPPVSSSGQPSDTDLSGSTDWLFEAATGLPMVSSRGESAAGTTAELRLRLARGADGAPDTFTGTYELRTDHGTVAGSVSGEAILIEGADDVWQLRGRSLLTGGTWNASGGSGGFAASITVNTAPNEDDEVVWRVDGVLP